MAPKRQLRPGDEDGAELSNKRRHFASTIFKGQNYGRTVQESMPCMEPIIRKMVQEAVEHAIDRFLRSSYNQVECSVSRSLQLQFHCNLPDTLFTGNRLLSEERNPIKVVLYNSITKQIVTSGPLSSLKVTIFVLDGDFVPDDREDWTTKEFDSKLVKTREGKKPLMAGESKVTLKNGVGYIGELSFTDNSSWIRSGKFRLGAKANTGDEINIREAVSNAFRVKDHRGETYQKHYPPSLGDEVWRLEKIAKEGSSHKKLNEYRIFSVGDFLRFYFRDCLKLRTILHVSTKTWETIVGHATTCKIDDQKYMYKTAQGMGLLFNSVHEVVEVTFNGQNYHPLNCLDNHHKMMVENLKQQAYEKSTEWVSVSDASIAGYPMLLESPAVTSFINPSHGVSFPDQDQCTNIGTVHSTISPSYKTEVEQDNCSFELGVSSHSIQGFNPTFRNSFGISDSLVGFCIGGHHTCASGGNCVVSQLSTDDNFQVESLAWQGNGLFFYPGNQEIGIFSSDSGMLIPRNERPKTRWCKVLLVVKWRILVRRNVAARKWKSFYSYM